MNLTNRQIQILQLGAQGLQTKQIADRLCASIKTVETHRAAIAERLGARNFTHAVALGLKSGIIDATVITPKAS